MCYIVLLCSIIHFIILQLLCMQINSFFIILRPTGADANRNYNIDDDDDAEKQIRSDNGSGTVKMSVKEEVERAVCLIRTGYCDFLSVVKIIMLSCVMYV